MKNIIINAYALRTSGTLPIYRQFISHLSTHVNGFLIEENDIDDFRKKLMLLMSNSDLRVAMGKRARLDVQNYLKETIVQKWSALFMSLND